MRTEINAEDVIYKQLGKYVALNWTPARIHMEGLSRVCPVRRHSKGPKPTMHGAEAKGKNNKESTDSQWEFRDHEASPWEQKKLIAASIEISIIASFKNHVYCFGSKAYKQVKGGPIGSKLTMAVARIIMMIFGRLFRDHLTETGITDWLETCR